MYLNVAKMNRLQPLTLKKIVFFFFAVYKPQNTVVHTSMKTYL